jgi:1-deoxy-D-xylulose-5-phosphate synthase
MCVDRAGIVGADGETHQGLLDMAFFRLVPNLTIMAPKDFKELEEMLEFAIKLNKPVIIRYPRGGEEDYKFQESTNSEYTKIEEGRAEILKEGKDISIIAIGKMVSRAMKIAEELEKENINTDVINARFLKPLDIKTIKNSIAKTKKVITIEDGTIINGLATAIKELIIDENLRDIKLECFAYPDKFIQHGSVQELEEIYDLDEKSIITKIRSKILN